MFFLPFSIHLKKPKRTEFQILMATLAEVQTSLNGLHDAITAEIADKNATIAARDATIVDLTAQLAAVGTPAATAADLDTLQTTVASLTAQAVAG
jgi:hypothetical protein